MSLFFLSPIGNSKIDVRNPEVSEEATMSLSRNVGLMEGLKYQGGNTMLAWLLHRITGIGMVLLVGLHVLASFLFHQTESDWAMGINLIYESWYFQIIVVFCVVYHALNGLRLVLQDIWPNLIPHQQKAIWLEWGIFIVIYGVALAVLVQRGLSGA
jgi:succinate dehydrogenase / fumarate reductase cytochrome b subunit